jgi:hypothetical protein
MPRETHAPRTLLATLRSGAESLGPCGTGSLFPQCTTGPCSRASPAADSIYSGNADRNAAGL